MSERSFAAWSVGLALVFAVVVPEPHRSPGSADWQAQTQAPAAATAEPDSTGPLVMAGPVVVERKARTSGEDEGFMRLLARPGDYARAELSSTRVNAAAPSVLPK